MEGGAVINSETMKMENPPEMTAPPSLASGGGLTRQGSMSKTNCLCSPTTHAGSFRCRLHRAPSGGGGGGLQRTRSIDSPSAIREPYSKADQNGKGTAMHAQ